VQSLMSNDMGAIIDATTNLRKLLSMERTPPIEEVINAGVVPRLVQLLGTSDNPIFQFEVCEHF
jgi:importin subunit alpha-1